MTKPPRQWKSTLPQRSRKIKKSGTPTRKTKVKPRNAERAAKNLLHAYGPPERRTWMRNQSCLCCGLRGYSVSAHIENDGHGRKAHYSKTIPLCCASRRGSEGCHQKFDAYKVLPVWVDGGTVKRGEARATELAERVEHHWLSVLASRSPAPSPTTTEN